MIDHDEVTDDDLYESVCHAAEIEQHEQWLLDEAEFEDEQKAKEKP